MSEEIARAVVWTILFVALVVWMLGVRFVARVRRTSRQAAEPDRLNFEVEDAPVDEIVGQTAIDQGPQDLAQKLARALAQPQVSQLGAVKVTSANDQGVTFEQVENLDARLPIRIRQGEVRFTPAEAGRAVAHYRLRVDQGRGRLLAAGLVLAGGFVGIVIAWFVMEQYVISNPDPAVRWQSLQSLQVVHLLWPPFALAAVYRASRTAAAARLEAMLGNLPHLP